MLRKRQKMSERRFSNSTKPRAIEMILDPVFAGPGRNAFEHLRAPFMVARIAAHEQNVDRSVLAGCKWGKLRIVSG